ncbi:MAG TPA: hypothetical protein VHO68_02320 [Bacteroidales bacterium]|jgi:hypothetical protein|nr:hypothetical protein [Bacteroidales bacterium]
MNWRKKYKLLQKFSIIKGKDLKYRIGEETQMLKKLKDKLGKTEEEILGIIIDL